MKDEHGTLNLVSMVQKYSDEDATRELLEPLRWPECPVCPHCQAKEVYRLTPKADSKRPARKGRLKCNACRKQFFVTVGTIFEGSHIPPGKWLMATFLICSSKKAMSAHQLHRMLGVTHKSAWFMAHRIRHGLPQNVFAAQLRDEVAVDGTFVGGKKRGQGRHFMGNKTQVVALAEKHGSVRTRVVADVTAKTLHKAIKEELAASATIMTDQHQSCNGIGEHFAGEHHTVDHGVREYARGEVTTIYPKTGPSKVLCRFAPAIKEKAKQAIEKVVRVHGRKWYRPTRRPLTGLMQPNLRKFNERRMRNTP